MTTIKQLHDKWAAQCMPKDAPQIQRQEMERAFYSGALSFFQLQVCEIAKLPDPEAFKVMEAISAEIIDYFQLLRKIPGPEGTQRQ